MPPSLCMQLGEGLEMTFDLLANPQVPEKYELAVIASY